MTVRFKFAATLLAMLSLLVAGCSDNGQTGDEGVATDSDPVGERPSGPQAGLAGIDPTITAAVAPYDALSSAESVQLEIRISAHARELVGRCLATQGFDPLEPVEIPDIEQLRLGANAVFPDIEYIRDHGLPPVDPDPDATSSEPAKGPPPADPVLPPGYVEAIEDCSPSTDGQEREAAEAFSVVRSAWQDELDDIDADEALVALRAGFSECVVGEGVPAESASDETRFLNYVDDQLIAASGRPERAEVLREFGGMYVECGGDYLTARENVRAERRERFLREWEQQISTIATYFGS